MQVYNIDNKPYIHKDVMLGLGIITQRYLWSGKKMPSWWDVKLLPENKKITVIGYDALLEEHKQKVVNEIGNPYELIVREPVLALITINRAAYDYFVAYTYNGGEKLPYKRVLQYTRAEAILTFINTYTDIKQVRKTFGMNAPTFYQHITNIIQEEKNRGVKPDYEGQLQLDGKFPSSYVKLIKRANEYKAAKGDYSFFIHKNFGNDHRLLVTEATEQLFNDIYVMNNKPNYTQVHKHYSDFVAGITSIVNLGTAEQYNPAQFAPLSSSTVYEYVSAWENKTVTHKKRSSDKIMYNDTYRPYASLENPSFAGSLLSMDDRDLPFKTITGVRVKAYLAMDVCSECFVGQAYDATDKDIRLVMDCFANLYQHLLANGYNQPAEVEVEQHLMSTLKEGILQPGAVFPYVRFAQAANPQEKSIERAFRRMRYGVDKQVDGWIPRPFARDESNQSRTEDDIKTAYTPAEVIEIAKSNITTWNSQPHSDQRKFKGLTRLQVWQQRQNPNLLPIAWPQVARYIGKQTETSINRGELRAFNQLYVLPKMKDVAKLDNGKDLTVYGIQNEYGYTPEVHIYKNNEYIITAFQKAKWQKARIEQTDADKLAMATQQSYTAGFDLTVKTKKAKLSELLIMNNATITQAMEQPVVVLEPAPQQQLAEVTDYNNYAIDSL